LSNSRSRSALLTSLTS